MYYQHFGFRSPPFKITPDTSLFFPGGNRGAILEALNYAVCNGEGIIKVVGEVGSGKTMLCRMLELELPKNIEIVYLGNPRVSPEHILHAIAFELKLPIRDEDNQLLVLHKLHEYLLERHAENRQVVMFVEEAQAMPLATLEEIRLLSNLETNQHKLLQIVLFGQPELDEALSKPQIRQLKERITYHFNLEPLKRGEIRDYLLARLRSCGYRGPNLFTSGALTLITRYSRGLLRRVNILADKSLLAAYAGNSTKVRRRHVKIAARDSDFTSRWWPWLLWPATLTLVAASAGGYLYYYQGALPWQPRSVAAPANAPVDAEGRGDATPAAGAGPGPAALQMIELGRQPLAAGFASGLQSDGNKTHTEETGMLLTSASPSGTLRVNQAPEITGLGSDEVVLANGVTKQMVRQLQKLPPEDVWLGAPRTPETVCRQCTAILYRPVQGIENL